MSIIKILLENAGVDPDDVAGEDTRNRSNQTVRRDHEIDGDELEPSRPPTTFDLPPFGQEQLNLLTDVDLTQGDPDTGETESIFAVELEAEDDGGEPLDDKEVTVGVTVTDHLGTDPFNDAPNDALGGSTTLEFKDGEESFTIGGDDRGDSDLTLGFFGFLPEVNDVETIKIDAPDDVEIVDRTLELEPAPDTAVQTVEAAAKKDSDSGFTETIEERE